MQKFICTIFGMKTKWKGFSELFYVPEKDVKDATSKFLLKQFHFKFFKKDNFFLRMVNLNLRVLNYNIRSPNFSPWKHKSLKIIVIAGIPC